jgi:hypothetical protein
MPQQHISEDQIDLYAMGTLPGDMTPEVEEHLLACESCRERLERADEFALLFREAAVRPDSRRTSRWWENWRRRAMAGVAATATAAAVFIMVARRETPLVAPVAVSMYAMRGPETAPQIAAGRPALLVFDLQATPAEEYEARLVDLSGTEVMKARAEIKDGRVSVTVERLSKGSYWVRLYRAGANDAVAEYGLRVQ